MSEESEKVFWFGKHKDKHLSEVPAGYLRWMVENMDPVPLHKYRFHEDGTPMTDEEVKAMEERTRNFIGEAEDEIAKREQDDR